MAKLGDNIKGEIIMFHNKIDHDAPERKHHRFFRFGKSIEEKLTMGSNLAQTCRGQVEYVLKGEGSVILCIHGGYGGYDQSFFFEPLIDYGFSVLVPSRPGYLRTPLETGKTFTEAADAFAALLDELDIDKVIVHTVSGGGTTGLEFAMRHPDRTTALLMECSVSRRYNINPEQTSSAWVNAVFFSSPGIWFETMMAQYMPKSFARQMVKEESYLDKEKCEELVNHIIADKKKTELLVKLIHTMGPYKLRRKGLENELEQHAAYPENPPLEKVQCDTLIVHGKKDRDVLFNIHPVYAAEHIPNVETYWSENGFHILPLGDDADEILTIKADFCKQFFH